MQKVNQSHGRIDTSKSLYLNTLLCLMILPDVHNCYISRQTERHNVVLCYCYYRSSAQVVSKDARVKALTEELDSLNLKYENTIKVSVSVCTSVCVRVVYNGVCVCVCV